MLAIEETERRREIQQAYNEEHGITPTDDPEICAGSDQYFKEGRSRKRLQFEKDPESMSARELEKLIADIQKKMKKAAAELNFEAAAELRDKMIELKKHACGYVGEACNTKSDEISSVRV